MAFQGLYVPPTVTVDGVVFQLIDDQLCVLLIQRAQEPFAGSWALPGGYCAAGETTAEALKRILAAKTGLRETQLTHLQQLYTFDSVGRDPRGHAVSITYMGLGKNIALEQGGSRQHPAFHPLTHLPALAFDHATIIENARQRLRAEIVSSNLAAALVPQQFTLTELQTAYEAILGHKIDKRNFRKRIAALDILKETDEQRREGAHRPARLYAFAHASPRASTPQFL
jgi:8-oxo-dGTP diphosphatase